jgi:hypothetical protein
VIKSIVDVFSHIEVADFSFAHLSSAIQPHFPLACQNLLHTAGPPLLIIMLLLEGVCGFIGSELGIGVDSPETINLFVVSIVLDNSLGEEASCLATALIFLR